MANETEERIVMDLEARLKDDQDGGVALRSGGRHLRTDRGDRRDLAKGCLPRGVPESSARSRPAWNRRTSFWTGSGPITTGSPSAPHTLRTRRPPMLDSVPVRAALVALVLHQCPSWAQTDGGVPQGSSAWLGEPYGYVANQESLRSLLYDFRDPRSASPSSSARKSAPLPTTRSPSCRARTFSPRSIPDSAWSGSLTGPRSTCTTAPKRSRKPWTSPSPCATSSGPP